MPKQIKLAKSFRGVEKRNREQSNTQWMEHLTLETINTIHIKPSTILGALLSLPKAKHSNHFMFFTTPKNKASYFCKKAATVSQNGGRGHNV